MQKKMQTNQLNQNEMAELLEKANVAVLATINADGTPYAVPLNFVYAEGKLYVHGLPKGQKMENLTANPNVSVCVFNMDGITVNAGGTSCNASAKYQSVILVGKASVIMEFDAKKNALAKIVGKYTPQLSPDNMPMAMIEKTAVVEIAIETITGKYHK